MQEGDDLKKACGDDPEAAFLLALIKECKKCGSNINFGPIVEMIRMRPEAGQQIVCKKDKMCIDKPYPICYDESSKD